MKYVLTIQIDIDLILSYLYTRLYPWVSYSIKANRNVEICELFYHQVSVVNPIVNVGASNIYIDIHCLCKFPYIRQTDWESLISSLGRKIGFERIIKVILQTSGIPERYLYLNKTRLTVFFYLGSKVYAISVWRKSKRIC